MNTLQSSAQLGMGQIFDNDTYTVWVEGFEIQLTLMNDFTMRHGIAVMNGDRPRYMYYATVPNGAAFDGSQFYPSPNAAQLGIWAIAIELIGWLCIRPGDTDGEYFDRHGYTASQLEWANSTECELYSDSVMLDQWISGDIELMDPMVEYDGHLWSKYGLTYAYTEYDDEEENGITELVGIGILIRRGHYSAPIAPSAQHDSMVEEEAITPDDNGGAYNGWANRATWNTALWAMNTEWRYNLICAAFGIGGDFEYSPMGARLLCELLLFPSAYTPDGHSLEWVDWVEVAAAFNECRPYAPSAQLRSIGGA